MHQFFNSGAGFRNRKVLQKCAKLHNECNFPGCKILPDTNGSDKRQGHQYVGLNIKGSYKPDHGL